MRTFSNAAISELNRKQGIEPVLFIGVQWGDNTDEVFYSSTKLAGAAQQIITLSGLETTQQLEGTGASQSVTVVLSDTNGRLSEVLDNIDVHKRPAKVYLGFPGVPISDAVTLIDGEINSDMSWDERARTFTFSILSRIEARPFGFSAEDGLFHKVDSSTRSKAWPFRFGTTCSYPTVRIQNGIVGLLRQGQGVLDATIDAKICQARTITCPLIPDPLDTSTETLTDAENATRATADFNTAIANDPFGPQPDTTFGTVTGRPTNELGQGGLGQRADIDGVSRPLIRDRECERGKFETLCQLLRDRANQLVFINDTLEIVGGDEFPQGQTVTIRVSDVVYTGVFSGETFTIETTNRLDRPVENIDCNNVSPLTQGFRPIDDPAPANLAACENPTSVYELRVIGGAGEAWRLLGAIADSKFKWLSAGTKVHLEESSTVVNIVSLSPGVVTGVSAYRTFGDTKQLTELPTDYYTLVETDYGDLTATEIWLDRPLDSYPDENWDKTVYATFASTLGPNPTDALKWIIDRYTDFTWDVTSFNAAETLLTNYPCNLYYASKQNVIQVLNQIAYEARCALTITDNVVKLTYLPKEPTAVKTFTEADIVAGSFKYNLSRTEELVTSSRVTWQPWGAELLSTDDEDRSFTVENNVRKYGYFGTDRRYTTINNEAQALKTATFWNIRQSNTWREISFQTTLEHMNLELFDCVEINIAKYPNVKTVIKAMSVDPASGLVTFIAWTPVLAGTTETALWAWPAAVNQLEPYPESDLKIEAPLVSVTPPVGHPLYIDQPDNVLRPSTGDRFPSDLGDTFPFTVCQDLTDPILVDEIEPQFNSIGFPTDTAVQATRADETAASGPSFNFEESEENTVCGRPSFEACVWEVNVQYGTATTIGYDVAGGAELSGGLPEGCDPNPNGPCDTVHKGVRCLGTQFFWCKTFGSELMAQAYAGGIQSQINAGWCSWRVGKVGPVSVTGPTKRATDPSCVGMGGGEVSSQAG
jgi:hypothetical protein